jgi:hypothetical protein
MTAYEVFLCGFAGSFAVDVVAVAQVYNAQTIVVPERYKKKAFYVVRLLLAIIAGGLALAYEIDKPLLAINIGAATPLIIQAFAQGLGNIPTVAPSDSGHPVAPTSHR